MSANDNPNQQQSGSTGDSTVNNNEGSSSSNTNGESAGGILRASALALASANSANRSSLLQQGLLAGATATRSSSAQAGGASQQPSAALLEALLQQRNRPGGAAGTPAASLLAGNPLLQLQLQNGQHEQRQFLQHLFARQSQQNALQRQQQSSQAQSLAALLPLQQPATALNDNTGMLLHRLLLNGGGLQSILNPGGSNNMEDLLHRALQQPPQQSQVDPTSNALLRLLLSPNQPNPQPNEAFLLQQLLSGGSSSEANDALMPPSGSQALLRLRNHMASLQQQTRGAADLPTGAAPSASAGTAVAPQAVVSGGGRAATASDSRVASERPADIMVPQPEDSSNNDDDNTPRRKPRGRSATFPRKLYEVIMDLETKEGGSDVASFMPHGRAFRIHKPAEFTRDIMPQYFQMSSFSSFQRQLNLYDFQRITEGPERDAYYHELFIRGEQANVNHIRRNRVKGLTRAKQEERFNTYERLKQAGNRKDEEGRPT